MARPTIKEWILKQAKLRKGDLDVLRNYEMYVKAVAETGSSASYDSYLRYTRELSLMASVATEESPTELYEEWDAELLLEILEEEIKAQDKKLTTGEVREIAVERGIPFGAFTHHIPNLSSKVNELYRVNGLSIKDDIKIEKLQQEIRALKADKKKLLKTHATIEQVTDFLTENVTKYEPLPFQPIVSEERKTNKVAICGAFDNHFGETVSLHDTMGINEYNEAIALDRLQQTFQGIIEKGRSFGVDHIEFLMGGDHLGGLIHEEIMRNGDVEIGKAIFIISDAIAQGIRKLTEHFSTVNVRATVGNHGRMLQGKPYYQEYASNNFDYVVARMVEGAVGHLVNEFTVPESIFTPFRLFNYDLLLTHGHIFKGGNGFSVVPNTIPRDSAKVEGMLKQADDLARTLDLRAIFIGHFHRAAITNSFIGDMPIYLSGSTKGADAFSMGAVKMASAPSQLFVTFDETGPVDYSPIWLN